MHTYHVRRFGGFLWWPDCCSEKALTVLARAWLPNSVGVSTKEAKSDASHIAADLPFIIGLIPTGGDGGGGVPGSAAGAAGATGGGGGARRVGGAPAAGA